MVIERRHARLAPLVGAFVLGALIILLFITFSLKQIVLSGRTYTIPVLFRRISGLEVGAKVKVYGYDAGQVKRISYQSGPYPVEVLLQIRKDIRLYPDCRVSIVTMGLIGDTIVEIAAGGPESGPPLGPDDKIYGISPFDFQDLVNYTPAILDNISRTLTSVQQIIADEQNRQSLANILRNTDGLTSVALSLMQANRERINTTLENLHDISQSLNEAVVELKQVTSSLNERVDRSMNKLDTSLDTMNRETQSVAGNLNTTLGDIRQTAAGLNSLIEQNQEDWRQITQSLRSSVQDVQLIVEKISRGQGTVGLAVNDPEVWIQLEAALRRMNEILGAQASAASLTLEYKAPQQAPPADR
ncbi:MAG: hypothetical protein Kow0059_07210 [Candidatus Sumerlaeia bacterium]